MKHFVQPVKRTAHRHLVTGIRTGDWARQSLPAPSPESTFSSRVALNLK
jgi:hypothetical protein